MSLMPFSICEKLELGEMRPTTISLQLADRSVQYSLGILEDVPIKVGGLYVLVCSDFRNERGYVHLHHSWRLFLATARCRIDVKKGKLSFDVRGDHVKFNLFKASKFLSISYECNKIDVVNGLIWETVPNLDSNDPLENLMLNDNTAKD